MVECFHFPLQLGNVGDYREVAESRTVGHLIWNMAYFHCDSLNYESQFIEQR